MRTDKGAALARIRRQVAACRSCRHHGVGKPVVGEGDPDAQVVFVGEAPGRHEAQSGRPFVGRAGQWLRQAIRQIGFDEQGVYLTNVVKYRPTDRKPCANDVAHGRNHLLQQLAIISPKIVVLLGATACRGVLNEKVAVRLRHGSVIEREGRLYVITCHPASAARFPAIRRAVQDDFRKLRTIIAAGRPMPMLRMGRRHSTRH